MKKAFRADGLDREKDIRDINNLDFNGIDLVIHCAAEVGRLHCEEATVDALTTNILGTHNVIRRCLWNDCKLINFSTSEVSFPLTNVYGITKDCAERLVRHYAHNHGLKAVTVRPMMLYGSGIKSSKYRSALDRFVRGAITNEEYEVHRGAVRSWLHINDFIEAIKLIVEKHDFNKYELYEIGSRDYRKMEDVAEMIGGNHVIDEPPAFLTPVKMSDYSKIEALGWQPKITLEEGLKELFAWHKTY